MSEPSRRAKPSEVKEYFSTPERPVTNTELINFKKEDEEGYGQVADGIGNGTLTY